MNGDGRIPILITATSTDSAGFIHKLYPIFLSLQRQLSTQWRIGSHDIERGCDGDGLGVGMDDGTIIIVIVRAARGF